MRAAVPAAQGLFSPSLRPLLAVNVMLGAAIVHAQSVGNAATPVAANAATVTIDNFSFSPETLTIKPGTKVTFVNHDDIPHTVVAVDKSFKSKVLDTDDTLRIHLHERGGHRLLLQPASAHEGEDCRCTVTVGLVIPGRCGAANPESSFTNSSRNLDSGPGARAPSRNDK